MKLTIHADQLGLSDEETTVFTIGRHNYRLAPLRFASVKRAFGPLEAFMGADRTDPKIMFEATTAIFCVLALGIIQTRRDAILYAEETGGAEASKALDEALARPPSPTADKTSAEILTEYLDEAVYPSEIEPLHDKVFELIAKSGMQLGNGTAPAPVAETGEEASTGTSTSSSPS